MRTGGKSALTVRGACLVAGLTFCLGIAQADDLIQIAINDDVVSVRADDVSLRSVLEELSRQTMMVVVSEEVLDEMVTIDFEGQSLPEIIRHLLRQKSFMLHQLSYDITEPGNSPYNRLWIFSVEPGDVAWATQPLPNDHGSVELVDYQLLASSNKSGDREDAMVGFSEVGGSNVIDYLQQGLSDPDKGVREAAVESLTELGGTESAQALSVALIHPDASMRISAVDALGEIGGPVAINLLRTAMADENHTVREAAAEWLTELAWQHD